jgi:hypothetical protein
MGDRDDQMFRRWEEQHEFENNNNDNNDNMYYANNNLPSVYPNNGSRTNFTVPANATDAIILDDIEEGENMVNFHDEAAHGRFYKRSSFNALEENPITGFKKNPFSRAIIRPGNIRRLTARKPAVAAAAPKLTRTQRRRAQRKRAAQRARALIAQQQGGRRRYRTARTTRRTK